MVLMSEYPDIVVPQKTFVEYVLEGISKQLPGKTAVVSCVTKASYTFKDVTDISLKLASYLKRSGLQKGDVVALCTPNVPEFLFVCLAAAACGATTTVCNPLYTSYEILYQFQNSQPVIVFTVPEHIQKVKIACDKLNYQKELIILGECDGFQSFNELVSQETSLFDYRSVKVDIYNDVLLLPYSSGTTGLPKGVMLSHYNFVSALEISKVTWKAFEDDVEYLVLPMFHIYGMLRSFSTLNQGGTLLLDQRFDLEKFAGTVQTYKVTSTPLVPPMLLSIAKSNIEKSYNMSSMRTIMVGAAPIAPELIRLVSKKFECQVNQAWGMTETTGVSVILNHMAWGIPTGSTGLICPLNYIKICDVITGEEVDEGEKGEILVKGPEVMIGYYRNPSATSEVFDADGFMRTGDVARFDEHKRIYVVDRVKELIKYKGFQVAPAEIEHILMSHPKISDAAVIGVADAEAGELPKAFVVRRDDSLTELQVKDFLKDKLSSYKQLSGGVEFIEKIPKSVSGKILRRFLREYSRKNNGTKPRPKL